MNIRNRWPDKLENHRFGALIKLDDIGHLLFEIEEANLRGDRVGVARATVAIEKLRQEARFNLLEMKRLTKESVTT